VPELVDKYLGGELPIDHYVTHTFDGVDKVRPSLLFLSLSSVCLCVCLCLLPCLSFTSHTPLAPVKSLDTGGAPWENVTTASDPLKMSSHTHIQVNDAIHALHAGDCLRAVVTYAKP
jgi:hypothetical protein